MDDRMKLSLRTMSVTVVAIVLFASAAAASPSPMDFCCICDCSLDAATSRAVVPEEGICIDVPQVITVNCSAACNNQDCIMVDAVEGSCSDVAGCPQNSKPAMAPLASAWGLALIAIGLATYGVRRLRIRPANQPL